MVTDKYKVIANGVTLACDRFDQEYAQLDGDTSGRSEDGTLYRDVIGMTTQLYCGFNMKSGTELREILSLLSLTNMNVNYYDFRTGTRVTKPCYVVADKIDVKLINGVEIATNFEIKFIQMNTDKR